MLGGALIEVFDWSAIFWVNVPVGLTGLVVTLAHVRESRDPNARRLDFGGAAFASAALFCLTLGLVETDDHAWTSAFTLGFLTALETGISWMTMNVPFLLVSPLAGRLQARFGARRVVSAGALLGGLGVLSFALLGTDSSFGQAVPGYLLVGLGYGTAAPAISAVAMGAIGVERAGVASGVLNTARQVGSAVGLAALGSIATAVAAGPLRDADDLVSGMRVAMLVAGGLALAASVLTVVAEPRAGRPAAA